MTDDDEERSFEQALLDVAEAQIEAEHYHLSIVIAQVAVEAVAEIAFTSLFAVNLPQSFVTLMEVLPDRSFMNRGTRRLWTEITGDQITKPKEEWKAYQAHVERAQSSSPRCDISAPRRFGWAHTRGR
jgi:hypothetical protein